MADCPICYLPCDPEIHGATLRVRRWFREQVRLSRKPWKPAKSKAKARENSPIIIPPRYTDLPTYTPWPKTRFGRR